MLYPNFVIMHWMVWLMTTFVWVSQISLFSVRWWVVWRNVHRSHWKDTTNGLAVLITFNTVSLSLHILKKRNIWCVSNNLRNFILLCELIMLTTTMIVMYIWRINWKYASNYILRKRNICTMKVYILVMSASDWLLEIIQFSARLLPKNWMMHIGWR